MASWKRLVVEGDLASKANLSGASFTGQVNIGSSTPFLYVGDGTSNNDNGWDTNLMLDSNQHSRIRVENRGNNRNLEIFSHTGTSHPGVRATDSSTRLYVGVSGKESYFDDTGTLTTDGDGDSSQWNTAYGWGDHSQAGYLTSQTDSQTLSFSSGSLSISNGNSVTIPDTNTNTTYSSGSGLQLIGTQFSIPNSAIDVDKLGSNAVTTVKIKDLNVTSDKLATGAVGHPSKLATGVVGADAVATGAINHPSKISTGVIDDTHIQAGAVGSSELNVSGNGTTSQFLRSNGSGAFTWATPSDNVGYTPGGTDVAVADGGTGSSTASGARTNLGLGTGNNVNFGTLTTQGAMESGGELNIEGDANLNSTLDVSGGSISNYEREVSWQWTCQWNMRYGYYYYPSLTYGMNYYNWNTSSSSARTYLLDSENPCFIAPFPFKIKQCYIGGTVTSTENLQLVLKKGTPNWSANQSSNITIANVTPSAYLANSSWTSGRRNKQGHYSLNVSVAEGDVLVPQLRKSTNTTNASTRYFRGVFVITGVKES